MSRGRHARDGQRRDAIRARARDTRARLRRAARDLLWTASDRLCARRLTFGLGHQIGELGWKLSGPFRATMTPAPDWKPGQEKPRPVDPPRVGRGAEVRAGATTTPGAVNADSGTRQGPAGTVPARQPEAGAPPAPAAAPAPPPPKAPGPGQHLGDLVILPGACAWDPDRSRISRLTAPAPCAETGALEAAP